MLTPISDIRLKPQKANTASLDQLQRLEAGVAVPADDDVVVDGDAERLGDLDDRLVIWMSARDGVGSPEGWLWTRIIAVADSSSARLTTSRG